MKEYIKAPNVAKGLEINRNTLRRWLLQYGDYITTKREGMAKYIHESSVPAIKLIKESYDKNMNVYEINKLLESEKESQDNLNKLQKVFDYSGHEIRTVVKGEEVWFVAKDICEVLEVGNPSQALSRLDEEEKTTITTNDTGGRPYKLSLVNESGLYNLIFTSRKDEAKKFKKWVTSEVIPSIRKHGAYMTDDVLERTINDPDYMIGLLTVLKEEKQKRVEAEKTVNILTHVNKTYTATEIAKELGFKSAIALNKDLQAKKLQYQQNGTWVFYSKYADKGYVEIKQDVLDNGRVIYHRRFTQIGREFLLKLYEKKEA